ncbi:MAG: hypothetical protein HN948_05285 [Clostridia bacterium]|jgi:hypothetical protein|nr:hypothetical protein [Clostridia bacterium]MBT7122406.1 hypothetical protein [Clostridia bacterium]
MLKLKEKSILWSIKHVNKYSDTNIFPLPFEFEAINHYLDEVVEYLKTLDVYSEGIRPYRKTIVPKSDVGFRIATQLDPIDTIITNAIIYEISEDIENSRIKTSEQKVFSYRLKPLKDGTLYDENCNWNLFNKKTKEYSENNIFQYVIVTDIADFYPSIYLHDIERVLRESVVNSGKKAHAEVIIKMIKAMHLHQTHKGLPIGPQLSRPIAEMILTDIDRDMLSNKIEFVRYVDDYRIFCKTKNEAYSTLAYLAQFLYNHRGLKLNENKTKILSIDDFIIQYPRIFRETVHDKVLLQFEELFEKLGISISPYDDIDEDILKKLQKDDAFKDLNSLGLLKEELTRNKLDYGFINFLINNLSKIDNTELANYILDNKNMQRLFPSLKSIINYFDRVRSFSPTQKHSIGKRVIEILNESFISELSFNRSWLLNIFTKNDEWNNQASLTKLLKKFEDPFAKRELMLCLGRSKNTTYYRRNKTQEMTSLNPWVKRAFIAGISCLPKEERVPWYKSRQLVNRDYLEKLIENWASKHPF